MSHILETRVAETTTSTGTGDVTLGGALTAHRAFADVCGTGDTTEYVIYAVDTAGAPTGDWEEGKGTYSAANTLTRTTVTRSSNANSPVNFSAGTKIVILTPLGSRVSVVPTGGTAGQVLTKNGANDFDVAWSTPGTGATNLAYTASPTGGTVASDTGTDATIPLADGTNAGLLTPAEKSKLAATSGTNTGDQDLSGYSLTSHNHAGVYDPAGAAASAAAAAAQAQTFANLILTGY